MRMKLHRISKCTAGFFGSMTRFSGSVLSNAQFEPTGCLLLLTSLRSASPCHRLKGRPGKGRKGQGPDQHLTRLFLETPLVCKTLQRDHAQRANMLLLKRGRACQLLHVPQCQETLTYPVAHPSPDVLPAFHVSPNFVPTLSVTASAIRIRPL